MNKKKDINSPILVTGMSRSGTTWIGETLSLASGIKYIYEPFNPGVSVRFLRYFRKHPLGITNMFTHINDKNEGEIYKKLARLMGSSPMTSRPLLKDPIAAFASAWLTDNFDTKVVVTIRHPAGIAASRLRLGWKFDFKQILKQESLMSGPLSSYRNELEDYVGSRRHDDNVSDSAWLWKIVYSFLLREAAKRGEWVVSRHEEFCHNPVENFSKLYKQLNLLLTDEILEGIRSQTQSDDDNNLKQIAKQHNHTRNSRTIPEAWKTILNKEQIERVRNITGDLGQAAYPDF